MSYYKLSERAWNQYKRFVKGNSNISLGDAEKKLNRNIVLGKLLFKNGYFNVFAYGFLLIATKQDKIIAIYNNTPKYAKVNKQVIAEEMI